MGYKMTQCTACGNYISAIACIFGFPHCGFTDCLDATIPPLEDIKVVGNGNYQKRLRDDCSSIKKLQSSSQEDSKKRNRCSSGATRKRESSIRQEEVS